MAKLKLYAEVCGTGPPVMLLHGFAASHYTWRHLVARLSKSHQVITVDLKGFGRSPKPKDHAYSLHDHTTLVRALIQERGLQGLTLVGHSLGGMVALLTTMQLLAAPKSPVSALILIDSLGYAQRLPWFISILRVPLLSSLVLHLVGSAKRYVRRGLRLAYYRPERVTEEQVNAYHTALNSRSARHALLLTARRIDLSNVQVAGYRSIAIPTLILWGRHDRITPLSIGRRLQRDLPNARFDVLEDCGHIPQEEKPNETAHLLVRFLNSRPHNYQPFIGQWGHADEQH